MAENTKIEWADHTQNFWIGCTKVSKACDHCYAEVSMPTRAMKVGWGSGVLRHRTAPSTWDMPKRWNGQHEAFYAEHGRRQRVFALSLGDWLDNEVPIEWFVDMLDVIRTTPNLDWLLLTKRIGNWHKRLEEALDSLAVVSTPYSSLIDWIQDWLDGKAPANVWLGITTCDQPEADRDIPKLLRVPAAKRFLSMEPLLGPVDLTGVWRHWNMSACEPGELPDVMIDWVIVGGESGPHARPMHLQWVRDIVRQCRSAGVPVLVKQLGREVLDDGMSSPGEHWPPEVVRRHVPRINERDPGFSVRLQHAKGGDPAEWPEDLRVRETPND